MDERMTREEFLKHLRDALGHLHNADRLRQNPLVVLFGVAGRFDASLALRRILTDAIASLRPTTDEAEQTRAWRIHDSLFCCYVQQLSQRVVSDQLGVSVRQLRREQRAALEVLADSLWERFSLGKELPEEAGAVRDREGGPSTNEELGWLRDTRPEKPTNLNQELLAVLDLARPLAAQHRVHLQNRTADALPDLAVHPVALSEMILNLLSVAILRSSGGQVTISTELLPWEVKVEIRGAGSPSERWVVLDDQVASLDMAHQLTELCRCRLTIPESEDAFSATLAIPVLEQLPVLVIDDNVDTLQLLQRYTSGTRYRLVGTQDPEQALSLAESLSPQIVVLDVMMPQIDGWRVLGRLRQHPLTGDIPILVCTIIPQEALALSLGASAFLCKPVTRQAFLAALDQYAELRDTESR